VYILGGVDGRRHELVVVHDLGVVVDTAEHQVQLVARLQRTADVGKRHQRRLAERHFQIDAELRLRRTLYAPAF